MRKFLDFMNNQQTRVQGMILLIVSFCNITTDRFWHFSIPAVVLFALQDIIDELRKP